MDKIKINLRYFPVTFSIIGVNILVYLITFLLSSLLVLNDFQLIYLEHFLYTSGTKTLNLHSFLQIFLSGFTHFSFLHIFFNMVFLFYIGRPLEALIKSKNYVIVYFSCLIISGIGVIYLSSPEHITIGASGALFGLLSFLVVYYFLNIKKLKHVIRIDGLVILLIINLIYTFIDPQISKVGHISGIISGIIMAIVIQSIQMIRVKKQK